MAGVDSAGCQPGQCQRIWCAVRIQALPFLRRSNRPEPSFKWKSKRWRAKPTAWLNVVKTGHPGRSVHKAVLPPEHHYSNFLCDYTVCLLSSVGFTALTTPLQCFPWREGSGNCKRQFSSVNTCICTRHETALVAEKENHAVTQGKQEGNRGQTNSWLSAPYIDDEKISHSDAIGKKQIAPSAHKSSWVSLIRSLLYGRQDWTQPTDASWCFSVSL